MLEHFAAKVTDSYFQTPHVAKHLDLSAKPPDHSRAGVATGKVDDVVARIKLAHEFQVVTVKHPSTHLAAVQAERNRAANNKGFVFAIK